MEWISVKDRLPSREGLMEDEHEYVLVWVQYDDLLGGDATVCGYGTDGWSRWDNFGSVDTDCITHWMPLPEAPEGYGSKLGLGSKPKKVFIVEDDD